MDLLTLGGDNPRIDFKGETYDLPHLKMAELVSWVSGLKDVPREIRAYATSPSELLRLAAAYPDTLLYLALRKVRKSTKLEDVETWGSMASRSADATAYMIRLVHTREEDSYKKKAPEVSPKPTATGLQKKPLSPESTGETPLKT